MVADAGRDSEKSAECRGTKSRFGAGAGAAGKAAAKAGGAVVKAGRAASRAAGKAGGAAGGAAGKAGEAAGGATGRVGEAAGDVAVKAAAVGSVLSGADIREFDSFVEAVTRVVVGLHEDCEQLKLDNADLRARVAELEARGAMSGGEGA